MSATFALGITAVCDGLQAASHSGARPDICVEEAFFAIRLTLQQAVENMGQKGGNLALTDSKRSRSDTSILAKTGGKIAGWQA